jgi:hypothetical protein
VLASVLSVRLSLGRNTARCLGFLPSRAAHAHRRFDKGPMVTSARLALGHIQVAACAAAVDIAVAQFYRYEPATSGLSKIAPGRPRDTIEIS